MMHQWHHNLAKKYSWYKSWHTDPLHTHYHWALFFAAGLIATSLIIGQISKLDVDLNLARAAYSPPPNSPLAKGEHPRIWITNDNIAEIRGKLAAGGGLHNDAKIWRTWLDKNYDIKWPSNQEGFAMLHYAFAYLMLKDGRLTGVSFDHTATEYGTKAKELLLDYVINLTGGQIGDEEQEPVIATYDWIYPLLSPSERVTVVNWMKTVDRKSDDGNPFNAVMASRYSYRVLSGIAAFGDGIDDAWAASHVGEYNKKYRDPTGITSSESFLSGQDGSCGEGRSYCFGHTIWRVLLAEEGYRTANGISLAQHYSGSDAWWLRYQPQNMAYYILPWANPNPSYPGGREWRQEKGQYYNAGYGLRERGFTAWLTALIGIYKTVDPNMASLAQWLINNRTGTMASDDYSILVDWIFSKFIIGPETPPTPLSPESAGLPTTRYFNEGNFVFRSDWTNVNAPYLTFYVGKWGQTPWHTPFYPGDFQIHRKGPQVIHQGGISGHDWGGGGGTGSGNMLIFPDRSITTPTGPHDDMGGPRRLIYPSGYGAFVNGTAFDRRETLRYQLADIPSGHDVDYAYADITRAYNSVRYYEAGYNPARISSNTRQFVYFRSASPGVDSDRVVVFDRAATTDTKFEKEWLFHTSGEPIVNGVETPGPSRNGSTAGKWTYIGATEVTATNTAYGSNGKTYLTPLLPVNPKIVKVGGPDPSGGKFTSGSHEYEDPYGVQHEYGGLWPELEQYIGSYRVEIIPSTPSLYDTFLNVIEVGDAGFTKSPTVLLQGNGLVGARTGNRIAAFNTNETILTSGHLVIDAAGTYKVLISDLKPGEAYNLQYGSTTSTQTASSAGTIYVDVTTTSPNTKLSISTGTPPSPSNGSEHAYFNALVVRPDHWKSYSLRPQAGAPITSPHYEKQLERQRDGGYAKCNVCPLDVTYDPANDPDPRKQDAAKVVIPADKVSLPNQPLLPIPKPNGSLLVTWDAWFGREFRFNNSGIGNYKNFQLASGRIWTEVRSRFALGQNQYNPPVTAPAIALVDVRQYGGIGPGTIRPPGWPPSDPSKYGGGAIGPMIAEFAIQPETWTRYWVLLKPTGETFEAIRDNQTITYPAYEFSLWVADENNDPVLLIDRVIIGPNMPNYDFWNEFYLEYNTSTNDIPPGRGPLVGYVRNIAMLKNVIDFAGIFQRPVGGGPPGPDTTPPVRSNGLPTGTLPAGTTSATLRVTTNEATTCKYSTAANVVYSSMANTFSTTGGTLHSTAVSGLSNGNTYNYYVRCIDAAGNANTNDYAITFSVGSSDTILPTVSITSPSNGATVSGAIIVSASASDNVGIAGIQFKVDGANLGIEDTTSPYSVSWNTNTATNGAHTLSAVARDATGNTNTSSITVNVNNVGDTTPPIRTNGQPTGTLPAGTTTATLQVTTNEAATCKYSTATNVAYSSMPNTFATTGGASHSSPLTGLTNGNSYNYYVRCRDTAGNANLNDYIISFSVASPGNVTRRIKLDPEGLPTKVVSGTLRLIHPVNGNIIREFSFTTNTNGEYEFNHPIPPHKLKLKVHVKGFLDRVLNDIDLNDNSPYVFPQLLAGDLNEDNVINSIDFSLLTLRWFNQDQSADLNGDGFINSLDFSLMNQHWFEQGEQ